MESILEKHRQMVLRLKKPGELIRQSLTAEDCDLFHMAGCLPGEAAELYDAIMGKDEETREELMEELGDFEFYLTACRDLFGMVRGVDTVGSITPSTSVNHLYGHAVQLMRLSGHLWDVVKRIVIYRKDRNAPDKKYQDRSLQNVAIIQLREIEVHFYGILGMLSIRLTDVCAANYDKLADADKGRYASGSYTDEQAQNRRDEQR